MSLGNGDLMFTDRDRALAPEYPVPCGLPFRGDWVMHKFDKFLNSDFVTQATLDNPAAGFFALVLRSVAIRQDPCGTLPADHRALGLLVGFGRDLAGWREVAPLALHGWGLCRVPMADGSDAWRLYHPDVSEAVAEGIKRMDRTAEASADGATRKGRSRLLERMRAAGCGVADCRSLEFVAAVEAELDAIGGPRTAEKVAEAVQRAARALAGVVPIARRG
jgi:hypothetical protein